MVDTIKQYYATYHDRIADKRHHSPYWLRRYAHRAIHHQFLPHLRAGQRVLDAGAGDGMLSCLIAQHGAEVVGVEISRPNVEAARMLAAEMGVRASFSQADVEALPFADKSFDVVVSSHVLEHIPDLQRGLHELHRVTRELALIAMPTCLNPACWVLLGGDSYWKLGRRSAVALPVGLIRTVAALARGEEGPDEGYGEGKAMPHVWRFPRVLRRQIESAGFVIERFEAGPLIFPYLAEYVPAVRRLHEALDRHRDAALLRNFGYGSMVVCRKR
jgi:SAM-dependent methyltransferase